MGSLFFYFTQRIIGVGTEAEMFFNLGNAMPSL
ncbi:MAG: hypothetical protein K0R05_1479 [Anaerocolumna sp.]|jgi:hypothetical protein|nr:hypothetical protein [Anaerocolumna sp.]